ncbi:mannonate dehydratase [Cyclobacterium jeungdonense]|uniref:Mannonate dehydratase n=1 Tax=Cyclobacterium jeungdonense TaxID=708087 RepID=A0ABT8CDR8_9BACT|nr:mannonate dehydratase [Cyclobacterium jeungdonense]MDN3689836.1 mannonate dehydratase [Cyclobacterium jeungdonense]
MSLIQSWRWFGPNDPVTLQEIRQAGASDVVSALHHIPHGEVWPLEEILERKRIIEEAGLVWTVVESVPVHESIKTKAEDCEHYLESYRKTLGNLGKAGIHLVCYNFMPVLDWTRTDLALDMSSGAKALYFDWADLAAFDLHELKREGAAKAYPFPIVEKAKQRWAGMAPDRKQELSDIILMGVPTEKSMTLEGLSSSIARYQSIGKNGLRENLVYFLRSIQKTCESNGITMTIHPDDPPYPILGLPRIVSGLEDLIFITDAVKESFNGICLCTGSLGAGKENDLPNIVSAVADRIQFVHLRNVKKDEWGNFHESDHLEGDVDMFEVMKRLVTINKGRAMPIPFRPDHGHQMLDDLQKQTIPGYSAIGRLKGLAELRGLEVALEKYL